MTPDEMGPEESSTLPNTRLSDASTIAVPAMPGAMSDGSLARGQSFGGYVIEKLLGAGSMGEVYLARQVRLIRPCAIKVLPPELSRTTGFQKRFEVEGMAMAKLDHPNIVRVFNAGEDDGRHFLEMEYVTGGSLDGLLAASKGKLDEGRVRALLTEILSSLVYAHGKGIVHRDLKPSNLLVTEDGHCKIGDFGLALVAGESFMNTLVHKSLLMSQLAGHGVAAISPDVQKTLTRAGNGRPKNARGAFGDPASIVGTPYYMSPEVQTGRGADARSDLFSVGVMAYRMLTGRLPVGVGKPPSKWVKGLDTAWDNWAVKCTEEEPEERFQSAKEALEALPGYSDTALELTRQAEELRRQKEALEAGNRELEAARRELEAEKERMENEKKRRAEEDVASNTRFKTEERQLKLSYLLKQVARVHELEDLLAQNKQTEKEKRGAVDENAARENHDFKIPEYDIAMVWIAPGTFTMGSPKSESGRSDNETQHQVTLTKGYWLGKYEVTQGQWQAVMGNNPSHIKNAGSNAPVEQVSWDDAQEFCKKLTQRERTAGRLPSVYEYTLPTEAQWEYACRAGTTGEYGGNGSLGSMGWYFDNSGSTTHPAGQKQPNAWGLYDMHGNVWEWCSDWYGGYPSGSVTDPTGATSGSLRVGRGGGWFNGATNCRSAFRNINDPSSRNLYLGFRLALSSVQ